MMYRRVPKFSPYGSVCCACAQRPGLPCACHSVRLARLHSTRTAAPVLLAHAEVTKIIIFCSMGPKLRHVTVACASEIAGAHVAFCAVPTWCRLLGAPLSFKPQFNERVRLSQGLLCAFNVFGGGTCSDFDYWQLNQVQCSLLYWSCSELVARCTQATDRH